LIRPAIEKIVDKRSEVINPAVYAQTFPPIGSAEPWCLSLATLAVSNRCASHELDRMLLVVVDRRPD
jgi:hypothetical protein